MTATETSAVAAEWNTTTELTAKTMPITVGTSGNAARSKTAPENGLSTVIAARPEGSGIRAGRAADLLASADTTTAGTPEAFRHADNPVLAAAVADSVVAAVVVADVVANYFPRLSNHS
jgi:hypothetical protein